MDENSAQVLKAIDVAKGMITNDDYMGARTKLLEVHYQFPSLANIPHMITACDILRVAQLTLPDGETDWYWVLQLGPTASPYQINSQHDKLSSLLDGIKEEFPGAATALQLVHNAFLVLSNIPNRQIFDSKRWISCEPCSFANSVDNSGCHSDKSVIQEQDSSQVQSHVSQDADLATISGSLDKKSSTVVELDASDDLLQDDEVHDSKKACGESIDVDPQNIVSSSDAKSIPSCWKPIHKEEVQNPGNSVTSTVDNDLPNEKPLPGLSATPTQRSNGGPYDFDGIRKPESFAVGQIWAAYDNENLPRRYAHINAISKSPFRLHITWLQPVPQSIDERQWYEVGLPVVCGLFKLHGDEEILVEPPIFSHMASYTASPTNDEFMIYPKENEVWAIYKYWKPFAWCGDPELRKGCTLQVVQIIEGYPRQEGVVVAALVKVDGFQNIYKKDDKDDAESCFEVPPRCIYRFSHRLPAHGIQERETSGVAVGMFEVDPLALDVSSFSATQSYQPLPPSKDSRGNSLKLKWSAEDFASGQVWAVYDGYDQMPRRYVVVNDVFSSGKVSVTYLVPHPISGEEISWVAENIPPGCGTFRKGTANTTLQMDKFSHLVEFDRSSKILYEIYPKKGEVWAMYRNWNRKWKRQDYDQSYCRVVEILSDFSKDTGVLISGLVEVPGYKTFFQRQLCDDGFSLNRFVLRPQILSFSHRIEAFAVPGIQMFGIPECSWHLEPDALPPLFPN